MKSKFATIDLCAVIHDLRELISMRVVNVYDVNSKTYIIKFQKPNEKAFILFESGIRIHRTTYDWPKAMFPSGFSMKFRKHINQKRLTNVSQVGIDRIIDLQFGDDERICHVIVELYDRGNVILTDHNYVILNILRPRTDADTDVRFSVRERYPLENARQENFLPSAENIGLFLENGKKGELLKRYLVRQSPFSSQLLDHALAVIGFPANAQIGVHVTNSEEDVKKVSDALALADKISKEISETKCTGYISYTTIERDGGKVSESYQEYYPYDFCQYRQDAKFHVLELPSFSESVDKFYSSIDSQKAEQRIMAVEKDASRKLDNIKKDHEHRLKALEEVQVIQERRGEYLQYNRDLVEQALLLTRTALANKMSWDEVKVWLDQVAEKGVEAAKRIVKLDFNSNSVTMRLSNPYEEGEEPLNVDIDIGLTADQNVRKYFGEKKSASVKQYKTVSASSKALKSAQLKMKSTVDQAKTRSSHMIHARKRFWFEKFYWFISSDSYLIIAGRDAQQNELLVKRYLRAGDIYVHAEIAGAASVIIRNRNNKEDAPPPRTLNEAGTMAICFSTAWEAKVVINAWWVRHDQVSRTAQTGEYLPSGSFMIRGKKNFLPSCQLQLGFGLLFRLDDEALERRKQALATSSSEEENKDESEDEEEQNETLDEFPDVEVNLKSMHLPSSADDANEYSVINLAPVQKVVKKTETEKYLESKQQAPKAAGEQQENNAMSKPMTKRQKHKLEKIRKKYKDQDEEERQIRMELLHGSTESENPEGSSGKPSGKEKGEKEQQPAAEDVDDEDEAGAESTQMDDEDGVLFTVPVCAPYSSMQKFKYKVKVTPGTGKRGKAVKMALALFMREKVATPAEKMLIKNLTTDDHVAQNLPGKVRVSAPMLNTKVK
ncbi:nuclear export mediator factor Nemf [Ditylenchus destructor]|nr:nuclear export mediator factor Nemf [Ditylenchus destructor]